MAEKLCPTLCVCDPVTQYRVAFVSLLMKCFRELWASFVFHLDLSWRIQQKHKSYKSSTPHINNVIQCSRLARQSNSGSWKFLKDLHKQRPGIYTFQAKNLQFPLSPKKEPQIQREFFRDDNLAGNINGLQGNNSALGCHNKKLCLDTNAVRGFGVTR